jgi:hypothetical protein
MKDIKSGKQIVDEFFDNIQNIEGVDEKIASTLSKLYKDGKFTTTNISNALLDLREDKE